MCSDAHSITLTPIHSSEPTENWKSSLLLKLLKCLCHYSQRLICVYVSLHPQIFTQCFFGHDLCTLRLHYKVVVGSTGRNLPRYLHTTVNMTSLPGFHIRKQMPHPPSFGLLRQSVYLVLYVVITHKIFINPGIT